MFFCRRYRNRVALFACFAAVIGLASVASVEANTTWQPADGSDDQWGTGANWTDGLPTVTGKAIFDDETQSSIGVNGSFSAETLSFTTDATSYTFAISSTSMLSIGTGGIENSSANKPQFLNNGQLLFQGTSTAANAILTNNTEATLIFSQAASSGSATISNGGSVLFSNTASAGQSLITNNTSGTITFTDSSSAGHATIVNNAAISFEDSAHGSNSALTNNTGATLTFTGSSVSAEMMTITNNGNTIFSNGANSGAATFTNNGSGTLAFVGNTTLDTYSRITNNGVLLFQDGASYRQAFLTNNATGNIVFSGSTTPLNISGEVGSLTNNGSVQFTDQTVAAQLGITNNSGATLRFDSLSRASNSQITNNGTTIFADQSQNISTEIVNNHGANLIAENDFSGSSGSWINSGTLTFQDNANPGSLSLNNNAGGVLVFSGSSTTSGGSLINDGQLDLSQENTGLAISAITGSGNIFLGSKTLILGGGTDEITTIAGSIKDGGLGGGTGGKLIVTGTGALALTGTNTYTGGTMITPGGGLFVGFGGTTGSITGNVTDNGTLVFAREDNYTFGGLISGTGVTVQVSLGSLILTANNTASGGTLIASGTLQLGNYGTTGRIAGPIEDDGSLAIAHTDAITMSNAISGSGKLIQMDTGTATLTGSNSYSGGTVLANGTLNLGSANAIGSSGTITFNGGILQFSASNTTDYSKRFSSAANQFFNLNTNGQNVTLASSLSGFDDWLGKSGDGTLLLKGNNSFGDEVYLGGGVLALGSANALGPANALDTTSVIIFGGGTMQFSPSNNKDYSTRFIGISNQQYNFDTNGQSVVLASAMTSPGGMLNKLGAGTLTLTANNRYDGGTTINSGTLQVGNNTTTGNLGTGNVIDSSMLVFNLKSSNTFAQIINGSGAVTQAGSGALTLSGSNGYSGGTALKSGTFNFSNANAIGTGTLTIAGASTIDNTTGSPLTLATNNAQAWNANFTFLGSNDLDLGTGTVTMNMTRTVTVTASTLTIGGVISGSTATTGLIKAGNGSLTLTGNNTYGGPTTVSGGILNIGNGGTTGSVGLGNVAVSSSAGLSFIRSDDITVSNLISGAGIVNQVGLGNLTLSGANTYTGGTVLWSGSVTLGNAKALGTGGLLVQNGGVVDLNGFSTTVTTLNLPWGTITNNGAGAATLTMNSSGASEIDGEIADGTSAVGLVKSGAGILTIFSSNDYSGGTVLNGGGLDLESSEAIGTGTLTIAGVSVLQNGIYGASLLALDTNNAQLWNANFFYTGSGGLDLGMGTVSMNATRTITVTDPCSPLLAGGAISGATASTGLTKAGPGTLVLYGDNTYGGVTTISSGTLTLGNGGTTGSLGMGNVVDNGTLGFDRSDDLKMSNVISGAGSIIQAGSGNLTLSGANTYTGGTVIQSGTVTLGNAKALGTGALTNFGVVDLNGFSTTVGALNHFDGTITNNGLVAATLTTNSKGASEIDGEIADGTSAVGLTKIGSGTLTIYSSNSYSGGTVLNGGVLDLESSEAIGTGTLTISGVSVLSSSPGLALDTNNAQQWNANFSYIGSGGLDLGTGTVSMNATRTITVTDPLSPLLVGGAISGATASTGLTKAGPGTLVLYGDNTYGGVTTISSGTLMVGNGDVTGSLGAGNVVDNGTLTFARSDDLMVSNIISGKGNIEQVSAGEFASGNLTLSGANTYSGTTFVTAGTLTVGNAKALGTSSVYIQSGTLDLNGYSVAISKLSGDSGVITNSGSSASLLTMNSNVNSSLSVSLQDGSNSVGLIKGGTGILTLNEDNAFSGGILLNAGGLNINSASALGTGTFTIAGVSTIDNTSGSPLVLTSNNAQKWNANFTYKGTAGLDLGGGAVTMNATRTVTVSSNSLGVDGGISGVTPTTGLTKAGAGTLILGGDNTYTGVTTISAGTLQIGSDDGGASIGPGNIVNNSMLIFHLWDYLTVANQISGTGALESQVWGGALTLTGTNSYTGGTVLSAGPTILGNAKALGATTGNLKFVNTDPGGGATLDLNGYNLTVGTLSGTGASTITNSGSFVSMLTTNSKSSSAFNGTIVDGTSAISFTKAGSGTLALNGSNTYSGGTVLSGGELDLNNNSALGTGPLTIAGVSTIGGSAWLGNIAQNWNADFTVNATDPDTGTLDLGTGAVAMNATRTITVGNGIIFEDGIISGATPTTGLTKAGSGDLVLSGNNTYGGITTVTAGELWIGIDGTTGSLGTGNVVDNASLIFDRSDDIVVSNVISGKGQLSNAGDGNLTLTGANSYSGGTNLSSGIITFGNTKALGTGTLTDNGGEVDLNGFSPSIGTVNLFAGEITNNGATAATLTTNSGEIDGALTDGASTLGLAKGGTGVLTINSENSYSGGTVLSAGTININSADAIGTGTLTINGAVTLGNTSGQDVGLETNNDQVWNANFTYKSDSALDLGAGNVVMNATRAITVTSGTLMVDGAISGAKATYGLSKTGMGTLVLAGNNTYGGATTISQGTLQLGNGGTSGSVAGNISDSGTLAFNRSDLLLESGTISAGGVVRQIGSGTTVLSGKNTYAGGTLLDDGAVEATNNSSLGRGPLTLNGGNLMVDSGVQLSLSGNLSWDSDAIITLSFPGISLTSSTSFASINITGKLLDLDDGTLKFDLNIGAAGMYSLLTVGKNGFGDLTVDDFELTSDSVGTGFFVISGNTLYFDDTEELHTAFATLDPASAPEPSTWTLLALAAGLIGWWSRRKKSPLSK